MAAPISINVTANAQGVYDEIIRQARRAEAIVKKIPLRIETKDLGGFKTLTADIDRFDKSVSRMSAVIVTFGQAAAVIFSIQNAFAAMVKSAINVEKKLTDINVIAKGSTNSLQKLSDGLFSIAKQTGQSFDVAATAAQEFSRQGLSVSETLKRTRDALTLTRIAGIDAAKATQSLTAIFNTFNKEALDTTKITNTLANLDVKFAVSVGDLTEALSRAGSTAADAKTSFAEMAAATTSLQQITARGGSVIGNSLKSIFTRLQRNDTVQALKEVGVNVRDLEGNMRPALKVLEELSKKFYTLSDAQRASIKEQVAGVYQINQLSALLADLSSSYSVYGRALNEANKSQDIASDRLELLKNNTAGSLNDIVVNLTRFSGEVGKVFLKPLVKGNLDIVNQVLEGTKGFSDSESAGSEIGKSVIKGLASYLGSGGALLIGKSLFNIFRLVAVGVKDQLVAATTLNRTSEKQLQLQEQVKAVILSQDAVIQRKIASTTTEVERQKVILGIIQEQTSAMLRLESVAARTAKFGISAGFSPVGGFKKGKTAAGGYLPSIMAEKQAINAGVGGANKGAKPVVVPNFNLGGGKRDTVVANSSEYIVPNFAGGDGSAIFNQKMIREYGLPRGAKRIMASGYVPNFKTNKEIGLFRCIELYGDKALRTDQPPPIDMAQPIKYAKFKTNKARRGHYSPTSFYDYKKLYKFFTRDSSSDLPTLVDILSNQHEVSSLPGLVSFSTKKNIARGFSSTFADSDARTIYSILFPKEKIVSSQQRLKKILDLSKKEKIKLLKGGIGLNLNRLLKRGPNQLSNFDKNSGNNAESEIAIFTKDIMEHGFARALAGGHIPNFVFGGKKARNYKLDFFSPLDGKPRFEIPSPKELFSKAGNSMEELLGGKGKAYLGDVVNHKELFQNYPFLEDLPLSLLPKNSKDYGVHSGFGPFGKIKLNRSLNRGQAGGTLIHELQHAVQGVEGHFLGDDKLYSKYQDKDYAKYRLIPSEIEAITAQKRFENIDLKKEFPDVLTSRIRSMLKEGGGHLDFARGYVPNFKKEYGSLMGEGSFGSFYNLRKGIGVKRFHSDKYPNDLVREYVASKVLENENIIPGVKGPKVVGSLKRSVKANRIGKQVVSDQLAETSLINGSGISRVLEAMLRDRGVSGVKGSPDFLDMNTGNFTVNTAGAEMLNSDRGRALISKYRYDEKGLGKLSKFFEKKGGLINIIDPGYLVFPKKIAKKYLASGFIPNFNPLKASLRREASSLQDLGYSKEEIFKSLRVQPSNRLKSKDNPSGLGVFNTLQGQHNISQALSDHSGENLHKAGIPNFASPTRATRDIFKFLRLIESGQADMPIGSRAFRAAPNPISTIQDIGANPGLLHNVTSRLAERIQAQIKSIDTAIKVTNLDAKSKASLRNQQKYLESVLKQMVQSAKKDPIAIKRPEILSVVSTEHERRVQAVNQHKEQKARKRAEDTAQREKLEAERDKKLQEKEQKIQSRVLLGSFALPMLGEAISTALGGENTQKGRLASGLGSAASTALTLGSFGGPFGIGAGALVGGYQAFSAIQGSRESFTGQFSANKELQAEVDKINAQQESFGAFMDSAAKFNDAKGGDKFAAADKLNATLRSFEDKDLSSQLSKIAFDPNLDVDVKAKKQVEVFNLAEEKRNSQTGIKTFRALYAEATDLTGPFKRLSGEVEVAPDKIKKFANSLASTVGPDQLKSPITDQFISDLIKKTGTGIEEQSASATDQIKAELKYILRSNQIQSGSSKNVEDAIASQLNLKKSASKFGQIQTQKDFQNKLPIDIFKVRSESPLVGEAEKIKADREASKAEIFADFASQIGGLETGVIKQLGDKGGKTSEILKLTSGLLDASKTNDFPKIIELLRGTKDTFSDMKDGEIGSIADDVEKIVQTSANQLSALTELNKEQDKVRLEAKILSAFDKMGVKGLENRGRGLTSSTTSLITAEARLKDLKRLPQTQENRIKVFGAESAVSNEFINNIQKRKELLGGEFSKSEKGQLRPKLLSSFENVTKNKSITDLNDAVNQLASTNGIGQRFAEQFDRLKKVLASGDTSKIPSEINRTEKNIFEQFYGSALNDPKGLNKQILQGGFSNLRTLGEFTAQNKISETAQVKTDELLGKTPIKPPNFPDTDKTNKGDLGNFSKAQTLLQKSTKIFSNSAEKLAEAITKEVQQNTTQSNKSKIDEQRNILKTENTSILEKKNRLEYLLSSKGNIEKQFKSGRGTNWYERNIQQWEAISGANDQGRQLKNSKEISDEMERNRLIRFQFAEQNPNSETGKEVISKVPEIEEIWKGLSEFKNPQKALSELEAQATAAAAALAAFQQKNPESNTPKTAPTNFDPYAAAIRRAKTKESLAGVPHSQIYVDRDKRLISHNNPLGIGIANRLDEPNGLFEGVDRKIARGKNPKLNEGNIPNFAQTEEEKKRLGLIFDSTKGGQVITSKPYVSEGSKALLYDSRYGYTKGNQPADNYYGNGKLELRHPNDLIPKGGAYPTNPLDLIPKGPRPPNPLDLIPKTAPAPHPLGDKPVYQGESKKPSINSTFGPIRISSSEEREINDQKYKQEQQKIFNSFKIKKDASRGFENNEFGPLSEPQTIFKNFKDKQNQSAIQKSNNKGLFENPKSVLGSNVAQNNSNESQSIERLQNLVASLSDTVVQIKQETSRSLNLNIGGSSISVKDFEEMENRILNTVKSWTNKVRTLEGGTKAILS